MFEPRVISVGSFLLPLSLLVIVLLAFLSVKASERFSPQREQIGKTVSDELPTLLLIYVLVYKFGPAVFDLGRVFQTPFLLLYSSGSFKSGVMAILVMIVWLWYKLRKSSHVWQMVDVLAVAGLLIIVGYNVIIRDLGETTPLWWGWDGGEYRYHPLNVYRLILLVPFTIWLLRRWKQLASGYASVWVAIAVGFTYTFTSFFDFNTNVSVVGLTAAQWISIFLMVAGWSMQLLLSKNGR